MNLNTVTLCGRLGQTPALKTTPSGQNVTSFSVATSRQWKDKNSGEKKEQTEWHNIVAWGRTAEVAAKFLVKGALVLLTGHLQTRTYTDKQNVERRITEIVVDHLQLGPKPAGATTKASAPADEGSEEFQVIESADEVEAPAEEVNINDI